jgi:hypothetical protein
MKPLVQVDTSLIYAMLALAVVQVIFILAMAGIMRTMAGPGAWVEMVVRQRPKGSVLLPFLFLAPQKPAQAYVDNSGTITNYQLFWCWRRSICSCS